MSARYTGGLVYNAPGGWSAQFSGSNYLTVPDNSAWVVDSDYTVEFWCNATSFPGQYNNIFNQRSSGTQYWGVNWDTSLGWCFFWNNGAGETKISRNQNSPLNTWVHFAFVKSGTTGYMFLNGVQAGATFTIGTISDFASLLYIGVWPTISDYFAGYLSNFRIVKGTALYTSNFTPPSGALSPVSNTALLTCRYPTIVDGSTNAFTITNTGSVAVSTLNPFPTSQLPNPALGGAGNGVYTMSQYAALKAANLWPAYDPYYKNVTLNLHGNAGAVLPFNTDASTNNFQVTQVGDTRPSNYTPFITNGYWSNYFNGTSDYLSVPDSDAFWIQGDFTFEAWVYQTSAKLVTIIGQLPISGNASFVFRIESSGKVSFFYQLTGGSGSNGAVSTSSVGYNTWNHIVWTRSGTTFKYFINGVQDATTQTISGTFQNGTGPVNIGLYNTGADTYMNGYISNARFVNGTAVYTGNFTPSTTPLTAISGTSLLTCQSNRFLDNSTNNFAVTVGGGTPSVNPYQPFTAPTGTSAYGSGYFDGSGDYLRAPTGYLTGVTTGDFTVEGWWNFGDFTIRTTYYQRLWSFGTGLANDITLNVDTSGNLIFRVNDSIIASQSANAMKLNSWNHVALVRSSGTVTIYLNGTSVASAANSSNISGQAGNPFYLGCESDGAGGYFYGYCSNVRITNTAVYTTTFTPSTTPLTAISGTSLLTVQTNAPSQNNTFLDSSTNNFVITRNGNTTQGTFTPYGSNWSNYFNGSTDYLSTNISAYAFGTANFTLEAWVYLNSFTGTPRLFYGFGSGVDELQVYITTAGVLGLETNNSNGATGGTIALNTWTHIAMVRNGSTITGYLNGTSVCTYTDAGDVTPTTALIGSYRGSQSYINGYVSNARVVKSAVYTSNFTPSTMPLTAITNTSLLTCQSNRFIDNSSNAYTITPTGSPSVQRFSAFSPTTAYSTSVIGGSCYFDGSGDSMTVGAAANCGSGGAFAMGANFTVEFWFYPLSTAEQTLIENFTGAGGPGWTIYRKAGGQVAIYNGTTEFAGSVVLLTNTWYHIAFVRTSSTSAKTYINGVADMSTSSFGSGEYYQSTYPLYVGQRNPGDGRNFYTYGYFSDVRVTKSAVYSANFTPPIAPLSPVANTSAMLNYTNAAISDNAMMNDLETVGNAQISTSVKKYGSASMYFNGSTNKVVTKTSPNMYMTGAFTIECWVYWTGTSAYYQNFVGSNDTFTSNASFFRVWGTAAPVNANKIGIGNPTHDGSSSVFSTSSLPVNAWTHVAATRDSSNIIRVFINGNLEKTGSADTSVYDFGQGGTCIGDSPWDGAQGWFSGYIDDLRITKGVARYTANFTPPTSQLQDQ